MIAQTETWQRISLS